MASRLNTILLAVLTAAFIGLAIYVVRKGQQVPEAGPPGEPGEPGEPAPPVVVEDNTPDAVIVETPATTTVVVQDTPDDNGAITMQEANYGQVMATKPFPDGFIPGPTASPCIVARYLLDLPGMPSYNPQERLPWTYEERLVLQTILQLCSDGTRVKTIQQNKGFGFLAYVIFREDVPYDYDYALIYQPKLGWQLIKCLDYRGNPCESVVGPYGPRKEEYYVPPIKPHVYYPPKPVHPVKPHPGGYGYGGHGGYGFGGYRKPHVPQGKNGKPVPPQGNKPVPPQGKNGKPYQPSPNEIPGFKGASPQFMSNFAAGLQFGGPWAARKNKDPVSSRKHK